MRIMRRLAEIVYVFALYIFFYHFCSSLKDKPFGERLHDALERLGIVFIKLGQLLATRNYFDKATQEWLEKLWDGRTPLPFDVIRPALEAEIELSRFDSFEREALAAASIAQVHVARYQGRKAAVKIVRPGAIEDMLLDISLARMGVSIGRHIFKFVRYLHAERAVDTVSELLMKEVDLLNEATGAEANQECYKDVDCIVVPEIWFKSRAVLVMEFIEGGIPANKWDEKYRALGYDPQKSIKNWFVYTFGWAFQLIDVPIHGDPHPANIFFLPDGKIGLIDFGVWGRGTERELRLFVSAVFAVYAEDAERVVEILLELSGSELDDPTLESLEREVARYVKKCRTRPFDWWLTELGDIIVKYQLPMPNVFVFICRFGIIGNKIAQDFFPGYSTIDLVGDEIRAGMRKYLLGQLKNIDPLPIVYALTKRAQRAPSDVSQFVLHPFDTIAEVLDIVLNPPQKQAA